MNEQRERDAIEALRSADPVDADRLPSASLARIRARVSEDVMVTTTAPRKIPWWGRGLGLAGAAVALGALVLVIAFGPAKAPGVIPGPSAGTGSAMCIEQYSAQTLARRTFAFDGIVRAIDGDKVTFEVVAAYRGADGASTTLDAPGMTGTSITSAGGPNLAVGERYLVAGDDHYVWGCGFTQPYDPTVAAEWQTALR